MKMKPKSHIEHNIKAHDRICGKYEQTYGEIFNTIEQNRLHKQLEQAAAFIKTFSTHKIAIDYGCGTGNLTRHLIDIGFHVISADVSKNFLALIKQRYADTKMSETLKINGQNLSNIEDNKFDFVATYSVLHHLPDYLQIIREMIRVTKPGGVIYLDHEVNKNYWNKSKTYLEFLQLVTPRKNWRAYLRFLNWRTYLKLPNYIIDKIQIIKNPRYQVGGDIHVWPDDHIEWERIEELLFNQKCEMILKEDYLLYRKGYPLNIYEEYKNKCSDYRALIARKR